MVPDQWAEELRERDEGRGESGDVGGGGKLAAPTSRREEKVAQGEGGGGGGGGTAGGGRGQRDLGGGGGDGGGGGGGECGCCAVGRLVSVFVEEQTRHTLWQGKRGSANKGGRAGEVGRDGVALCA
jgi:hypothetical protein